jgi:plastocyanin domain-containing protein
VNTTTKKIGGFAAGVLLSAGLLTATLPTPDARAHGDEQHVTVTITDKGYSPSSIAVKGGKRVAMTFVSKGDGCGNSVTIPALKKSFTLKKGQKKNIAFTPKKGQTIAFACSMNMYKGKVVAK